ncbi:MAG: IS1380 family transposase [Kosmotogaceae bacterium]
MKDNVCKTIEKYKENLEKRLENNNEESATPVFSAANIEYDISGRVSAIHCGGIGLVGQLVKKIKLPEMINNRLDLLKRHKPYFESDHILNIAYNIICGGTCLEDIELLRNNVAYMDAMGTKRIPDPTTAGDFLRRFEEKDVHTVMDISNEAAQHVWETTLDEDSRQAGIIDVDGKIQETYGECKEGMDMSYKGVWGFSTLAATEATTGTHLCVVNRPGNKLSQEGAGKWIDKAIAVVQKSFNKVYLRGDSAFALTDKFDEWSGNDVGFIFGYSKWQNLLKKADLLDKDEWRNIEKPQKGRGKERKKKHRVKRAMVIKREYETITQKNQYVAEFRYRPTKCERDYRVIVLKKIVDVTKGQRLLFEDCQYLFYITNIMDMSPIDLLRFIRGRCNHENKIEQLDNGIHALKMPTAEFMANWAYMAICSLAWNLKSWIGLVLPDKKMGKEIIACEFKSFQNKMINIPCQILNTGRKIVYRFLNYNPYVEAIFDALYEIQRPCFSSA